MFVLIFLRLQEMVRLSCIYYLITNLCAFFTAGIYIHERVLWPFLTNFDFPLENIKIREYPDYLDTYGKLLKRIILNSNKSKKSNINKREFVCKLGEQEKQFIREWNGREVKIITHRRINQARRRIF